MQILLGVSELRMVFKASEAARNIFKLITLQKMLISLIYEYINMYYYFY